LPGESEIRAEIGKLVQETLKKKKKLSAGDGEGAPTTGTHMEKGKVTAGATRVPKFFDDVINRELAKDVKVPPKVVLETAKRELGEVHDFTEEVQKNFKRRFTSQKAKLKRLERTPGAIRAAMFCDELIDRELSENA